MKLVDAHALQDLLTDNIDEHVSHYVVFTDHGTLLSHDKSLTKTSLMKFTPFAGTVWRNHNARIAASDSTNPSVGGLPSMKTLNFKLAEDGQGLEQLTVEMDGVISVMRLIVPSLLVAAQLASDKFEGEIDETTARMARTDVGENGDQISARDSNDERNDDESGNLSTRSDNQSEDEEEIEDEGGEDKLSKMRILELKVEGMAEFLADEYPEILPYDFY